MSEVERGPASAPGVPFPQGRITSPDFVDWHMILDYELSQLSKPETGVIGSFGFTTLGASIGFLPNAVVAWKKTNQIPPQGLEFIDLINFACCAVSIVAAVICLIVFGISYCRNKSLVSKIRIREKSEPFKV